MSSSSDSNHSASENEDHDDDEYVGSVSDQSKKQNSKLKSRKGKSIDDSSDDETNAGQITEIMEDPWKSVMKSNLSSDKTQEIVQTSKPSGMKYNEATMQLAESAAGKVASVGGVSKSALRAARDAVVASVQQEQHVAFADGKIEMEVKGRVAQLSFLNQGLIFSVGDILSKMSGHLTCTESTIDDVKMREYKLASLDSGNFDYNSCFVQRIIQKTSVMKNKQVHAYKAAYLDPIDVESELKSYQDTMVGAFSSLRSTTSPTIDLVYIRMYMTIKGDNGLYYVVGPEKTYYEDLFAFVPSSQAEKNYVFMSLSKIMTSKYPFQETFECIERWSKISAITIPAFVHFRKMCQEKYSQGSNCNVFFFAFMSKIGHAKAVPEDKERDIRSHLAISEKASSSEGQAISKRGKSTSPCKEYPFILEITEKPLTRPHRVAAKVNSKSFLMSSSQFKSLFLNGRKPDDLSEHPRFVNTTPEFHGQPFSIGTQVDIDSLVCSVKEVLKNYRDDHEKAINESEALERQGESVNKISLYIAKTAKSVNDAMLQYCLQYMIYVVKKFKIFSNEWEEGSYSIQRFLDSDREIIQLDETSNINSDRLREHIFGRQGQQEKTVSIYKLMYYMLGLILVNPMRPELNDIVQNLLRGIGNNVSITCQSFTGYKITQDNVREYFVTWCLTWFVSVFIWTVDRLVQGPSVSTQVIRVSDYKRQYDWFELPHALVRESDDHPSEFKLLPESMRPAFNFTPATVIHILAACKLSENSNLEHVDWETVEPDLRNSTSEQVINLAKSIVSDFKQLGPKLNPPVKEDQHTLDIPEAFLANIIVKIPEFHYVLIDKEARNVDSRPYTVAENLGARLKQVMDAEDDEYDPGEEIEGAARIEGEGEESEREEEPDEGESDDSPSPAPDQRAGAKRGADRAAPGPAPKQTAGAKRGADRAAPGAARRGRKRRARR